MTNRVAVRPAFVSDSAFSVGDMAYAAVVTAEYINRETGTFQITFDLLGWTGGYDPVSLTIDDTDIRAIREQLGIGHEVKRPFTYNELLTPKGRNDLETAIDALKKIANLDLAVDTWSKIAIRCIDIAQEALAKIEEASDGTPTDS